MTKRYSRRAFLVTTGAAGAATVLAGTTRAFATTGTSRTGARAASGRAATIGAVASLQRSEFAPLVGSKFRMANGTSSQPLILENVATLPNATPSSEGQFSLVFRGNRASAWDQGSYDLQHRATGTARLLVVPVDRGKKARRYQVIVNRA